jgi:hypothetical protein
MAETPQWRLVGDWFDVCKCTIPCPCTFAQAPSEGDCEGVLAWHIKVWADEGKVSMGIFIDERADDSQREGLQTIFGGRAGGWPGEFANVIGEVRGIEYVPIEFEIADDLAYWSATIPGKVTARAEALTGPTTPEGKRVQVHNPPGAEVGPGQTATWGVATADRAEGFGFKWEWDGRSSKHFPFDWSGPDD